MRTAFLSSSFLSLFATLGVAQTEVWGLDLFNDAFFTSNTGDFVGGYTPIGAPNNEQVYALDFDATATTLWGVRDSTKEYGTFDLTTGQFTAIGPVSGPTSIITGLTAAKNGTDWYLLEYGPSLTTHLWVGDITTGSFNYVGTMGLNSLMIDISIDVQGNLYGYDLLLNSLYSIDPSTGLATLIGPTGQPTEYAQGMDFDWSTGILYAALFNSDFSSVFAEMDLSTGFANVLQDTTPLSVECEIAVKSSGGSTMGSAYCFGDGSGMACPCGNNGVAGEGCANSSGSGGVVSSFGSSSASADLLWFNGSNLLPGQPALLFVGENAVNNGNGALFGDGLRCAGLNVIRLGVMVPDVNGDASWGPGLGALGGWTSGDVRRFQTWYRDPNGSPCGFGFNLTNGVEVTFTP